MNSARAAPHGTLSAEEEAELRSFYLELMERRTRDGWHAVEQMMKEIVSAMMAQAQGAAAAAAGAAAAHERRQQTKGGRVEKGSAQKGR